MLKSISIFFENDEVEKEERKNVKFYLLICETRDTDILRDGFTKRKPMFCFEKCVFAEEVFKTMIARITVTLFFTSVIEERIRMIKSNTTINTHPVFEAEIDIVVILVSGIVKPQCRDVVAEIVRLKSSHLLNCIQIAIVKKVFQFF
jgi:hypothetical protein